MSDALKELEKKAKSLTADERAQLAELLLESIHEPPAAEIEAAWDREIDERAAAYDRGELQTISAEDVLAEARRLARRSARGSLPRRVYSFSPKSSTTLKCNPAWASASPPRSRKPAPALSRFRTRGRLLAAICGTERATR
jgi:putative addiction module component (TIGR02574 family)